MAGQNCLPGNDELAIDDAEQYEEWWGSSATAKLGGRGKPQIPLVPRHPCHRRKQGHVSIEMPSKPPFSSAKLSQEDRHSPIQAEKGGYTWYLR